MQLKSVHPAKMSRRVNERARISSECSRATTSVNFNRTRLPPGVYSARHAQEEVVLLYGNEREKRAFRVALGRTELFERERKWLSMRTGSSSLRSCCCHKREPSGAWRGSSGDQWREKKMRTRTRKSGKNRSGVRKEGGWGKLPRECRGS